MSESHASAFLRVPWHQRLCALCGVSHPLHQGVLVDCHAWFLCIGGFSVEILCPPLDAVRVVLVSFSRVLLSPSVLFPALPGPRFALIITEALVPSLLRYSGTGPELRLISAEVLASVSKVAGVWRSLSWCLERVMLWRGTTGFIEIW